MSAATLTNFTGEMTDQTRFSVEYVGEKKFRIDGSIVPGPYALFCGGEGHWEYLHSASTVYHLIMQGKKLQKDFGLPDKKVIISVGCQYILDLEIAYYQQQRRIQGL